MDYPAKILLFGEYGIILNSMALAIPYRRFSGHLRFSDSVVFNQSNVEVKSNEALKKLLAFVKADTSKFHFINLHQFEIEVNKGLYFDSSVPIGSGLGSSGALTAAIYERYSKQTHQNDYQLIKTELAEIESCFHGKSSGFDTLISYLKKPVMIDQGSSIILDINLSPFFNHYTLFLIKTYSQGETSVLVKKFMDNYQHEVFKTNIDNQYIPIVNQVIGSLFRSEFTSFDKLISLYSQIQLSLFKAIIPKMMRNYFEHGITTSDFYLKICGSGAGGYFLGIARDRLKAEFYFNLNHLDWMVVNLSDV